MADYAYEDSPIARFEQIALALPDEPALDSGDRIVTYGEVYERVLGVSGRIAAREFIPGSRISLMGVCEINTYVAYLSILRDGHTVVPLGPNNPAAFQVSVVQQAGAVRVFMDAIQAAPLR